MVCLRVHLLYVDFRWDFDDPLFKKFVDLIEQGNESFGFGLLADFIPIFKYITTPCERKLREVTKVTNDFLLEYMDEHRKTFDPGKLMLNSTYICVCLYQNWSCQFKRLWSLLKLCFSYISTLKLKICYTVILENLRDLCDTLISCENEAKLESGNEVMKDMDEDHYVQLLSDVIVGRLLS